MQPLGLEQDIPDYDMDSADEHWEMAASEQMRRLDLTPLKFEQMKSSVQTVVTLNEVKALLKQDDEVSIAVYDYWLNKRLKMVRIFCFPDTSATVEQVFSLINDIWDPLIKLS